jgi:thiol-disulfide isomerase/thioredoxin
VEPGKQHCAEPHLMDIGTKTVRAPEIYGDFWFNSEPVALSALRGQVVLIGFWDYTNVNCIRAMPYYIEWHRRYRDYGLVLICVHTPQFSLARDPEAIERAIKRLGILHPVVTDNEYLIWEAFANRVWPATYLIDRDGYVRYTHAGEGSYGGTERAIQALLVEAGYHGGLPFPMDPVRETDKPGAVCYRTTPEICTGYVRGMIGNVEGLNLNSVIEYTDPKVYVDGRFYAHGPWFIERDCVQSQGGPDTECYLVLPYHAAEVNAVLKPEGLPSLQVAVDQDDRPLTREAKGDDISFDLQGRSVLDVNEPRMYNLVKNKGFGSHTLRLITRSNAFTIYSFTFVSCLIPEIVLADRS